MVMQEKPMTVAAAPEPTTKFKSFTYRTTLDRVAGRTAVSHSEGKPALPVASPPEFRGQAGMWTPEDLFVASIEVCLMLTFVGIAEKRGLHLASYESSAEGLLEWQPSSYRFTRVVIRPRIVVQNDHSLAAVREVIERAHETCLVANSVLCEVIVDPEITSVT
jgi:organic hydroperoxide reductase OsmC/OhrA